MIYINSKDTCIIKLHEAKIFEYENEELKELNNDIIIVIDEKKLMTEFASLIKNNKFEIIKSIFKR